MHTFKHFHMIWEYLGMICTNIYIYTYIYIYISVSISISISLSLSISISIRSGSYRSCPTEPQLRPRPFGRSMREKSEMRESRPGGKMRSDHVRSMEVSKVMAASHIVMDDSDDDLVLKPMVTTGDPHDLRPPPNN